jgi:hypothetical protein
MIYLFFLFGARLTTGRRQDCLMRIFEESVERTKGSKKFKLGERQANDCKSSEDITIISTGARRVASCRIRRNLQSMKMLIGSAPLHRTGLLSANGLFLSAVLS